jgi:error-prone DNA polymerase
MPSSRSQITDTPHPTPSTRHLAPDYVELRTRSAFSFLDGASLPEDLVERAAALGYSTLALGDHDGVYGAPRFYQAATRAGLRAIVGANIQAVRGQESRGGKGLRGYGVRGEENAFPTTPLTPNPLYLLVASRTGYQNLCRLITAAKLRARKGEAVTTWDDLEGHTDGLICLVRLLGEQGVNPLTFLARLQRLFPGRLYIDLQRHFDPDEERLNQALIAVARRYGLPLVATNDVRHATPDGRRLLDVLTCIRHKTTLDAAGRLLLQNAERHLKSPRAMAALFRDLPEALVNTRRIAEQCEFTLTDLGYRFPDYPLPPGETPIGHLRTLTYAGARERYGRLTDRVRRQLEHELAVIGRLDLAGYFLIVWDIVRFCRQQGILAQGRGSAANSAVCYALGITAVDAVGMDLLFERFLSEERGEWPDIDIDLPSGDQRERVIQYVYQRYGERGAAMTANVITYRTRSAVREVGKALGFSLEQVDRLSKLLRRFEFRDSADDLAVQLKAGGVDPAAPRVTLLVDLVQRIQHLPRHLGQHSGGMVIAAGRLDTVVPLEPASMPGRVVVQWDKDDCADLGIIKVDLLGLGMMAVLEEAIPLIREHEGTAIDLARLPPDDPRTYAMLQRADTIGVFQVESRAQMATLPRMRPERFYDLVVEVAIIRPGPIVGQMVHPYLNRRNGREPVTYAHPDLEPILARTLGVPIFQEQLLRMAMAVAGFTGGEAEELRRAMGFKRSTERMRQIEDRLRAGMARHGITGAKQDEIVRSITSFALYGFPESHAASFALLAYASAYLRAHHLAAFTCAMLNNWPLGFYHPATLVKDAQRHGLRVLPIDVTRSSWRCQLERGGRGWGGSGVKGEENAFPNIPPTANPQPPNPLTPTSLLLRLGLRYVAGLREETGKRIEAERVTRPFVSVADVILRCGLRDNEAQTLADLGAFAALGLTRRDALWQAAAVQREPLFRGLGGYGVKGLGVRGLGVGGEWGVEHGARISRTPGVAAGDGLGAGQLLPHTEDAEGRAIWLEQSDSSCGDFAAGEHCRGQWPQDAKGLREFPAGRTRRSAPGQPATDRTYFAASGVGSPPPQSPDPIPGSIDPSAPNPLTPSPISSCPLPEMSLLERTLADYRNSGMTVGPHVMTHLRGELARLGVMRAADLRRARNGQWVRVAGLVIVRQRPGTAKGLCFITLEDETGTANAAVMPDVFTAYRAVIHTAAFLLIEGPLQKVTTADAGEQVSGAGGRMPEGEDGGPGLPNPQPPTPNTRHPTPNTQHPTPDPRPSVIHVLARRLRAIELPQQPVTLTGTGYRMRVTPTASSHTHPPDTEHPPPALPKSHDFR